MGRGQVSRVVSYHGAMRAVNSPCTDGVCYFGWMAVSTTAMAHTARTIASLVYLRS